MDDKPKVVVPKDSKSCDTGYCIMSTPFGLATYLIGLLVILWVDWPYEIIGWIVLAAGFGYTWMRNRKKIRT